MQIVSNCWFDVQKKISGDLRNKKPKYKYPSYGTITVEATPLVMSSGVLALNCSGKKLDKKDGIFSGGKSDPYLIFYRGDPNGKYTPVHKTEYIKNTLDPNWASFNIPMHSLLSNLDINSPILIECWDWDSDGKDSLIGQFTTSYSDWINKGEFVSFPLIEPKIQAKKGSKYTNSGIIEIAWKYVQINSFLDFVMGGTEINMVFAIDYTLSNGRPDHKGSLHYIHKKSNKMNEYERAIYTIGNIVAPYDNDQIFPTYGFGAKIEGTHYDIFNVNLQQDPGIYSMDNVMMAYKNSLLTVDLHGPTNFTPIISVVCDQMKSAQNGEKYCILLMITDGEITDMKETVHQMKIACQLPLSIIIIGVGGGDFELMKELDDDEGKLFSRDCVQFVRFRDYEDKPIEELAKEVLAEVPRQLLGYMNSHKFQPKQN